MTTRKRNTKLSAREAVAGDRDLMKALMKEALQEVLEGEMTEFLGAAPSERTAEGTSPTRYSWTLISVGTPMRITPLLTRSRLRGGSAYS